MRIRLPPRHLPFALACQALLSVSGFLWAMMFSVALLWATFCSGDANVPDVPALRLWGGKTPAEVRSVEPTPLKVGGEPVGKVTYSFNAGGLDYSRTTYDFADHWKPGQPATALYLESAPEVSRLQGERRGHSGLFGSFLFFVPFAAVLLGFPAWRRGLREALLLREGLSADARLLDCLRLSRKVRGVPVCRCHYEFESLWGEVFRGRAVVPESTVAGPRAIGAGSVRRPALYLPRDASVSTLVDALPMRYGLKVDRYGDWVAGLKVLPVVSICVAGVSVALAMLCLILQAGGVLTDLGR